MTDNSTDLQKSINTTFDTILRSPEEKQRDAIQTVVSFKQRIDAILFITKMRNNDAFKERVRDELRLLSSPFLQNISTHGALAETYPTFYPDLETIEITHSGIKARSLAYIEKWIDIISTFQEELPNALSDRGAQQALFNSEITECMLKEWGNYSDMQPDRRRMWLLTGCMILLGASLFLDDLTQQLCENKTKFSKELAFFLERAFMPETRPLDKTKNEEPPNITTKILQSFIRPSSKAVQATFNNSLTLDIPQELRLEPKWSKKPITTAVTLGLSPKAIERKLNSLPSLTAYDKEAHHAVASLAAAGNEYFTPRMVYQAMTGDRNADLKPESPQYTEICDSLDKMMIITVEIDTAKEIKFYPGLEMKYSGPLLAIERVTAKLNNEVLKDVYHLFRPPILSTYSHDKKQVAAIPIEAHYVPKLDKRRGVILLQGYLEERVAAMKGKNNVENRRILYKSVYDFLGIPEGGTPTLKNKRMKTRDKIKKILERWKETKFIRGYTEVRQGRELYAVDIIL